MLSADGTDDDEKRLEVDSGCDGSSNIRSTEVKKHDIRGVQTRCSISRPQESVVVCSASGYGGEKRGHSRHLI